MMTLKRQVAKSKCKSLVNEQKLEATLDELERLRNSLSANNSELAASCAANNAIRSASSLLCSSGRLSC